MFPIVDWPSAIVHLDADAFFASVMQVIYPRYKGLPLVVGEERGIATAVSYEAKKLGINRGDKIWEIRKKFPQCIICQSDYDAYYIFSSRIFNILKKHLVLIEQYSVDEFFADVFGLARPLRKSYQQILVEIKKEIEESLGITVSIGLSLTKSLAKLASSFQKPSGLTIVSGKEIENFLKENALENIWGVGPKTAYFLKSLGLKTAYDFANLDENFILKKLNKTYFEIWQELHGKVVYKVNPLPKHKYQSIVRSATFSKKTNNKDFLWSQLVKHLEESFFKLRQLNYLAKKILIFIKTEKFQYFFSELKLDEPVDYPISIKDKIKNEFERIFNQKNFYRAAGVVLSDFVKKNEQQLMIFLDNNKKNEKFKQIYSLIETKKIDFGSILYEDKNYLEKRKEKKLNIPIIYY
ncbi:MAG: DNA polymerase Y family protein [Microgenomates group bacterium]